MKTKIINAIKTKYSHLGLSDAQIDGVATLLAYSVNSDEGIEQAVSNSESLLKSLQSESDRSRQEMSTANKKIADLEAKIKALTETGPKKEEKPPDTDPQTEMFNKLMEQMSSLTSEIATMKGEKLLNARQAELSDIIKPLPDSIKSAYQYLDLGKYSAEEFETMKSKIKQDVETISKDTQVKGTGFRPPFGGFGNGPDTKATKEEVEAVMKKLPLNL